MWTRSYLRGDALTDALDSVFRLLPLLFSAGSFTRGGHLIMSLRLATRLQPLSLTLTRTVVNRAAQRPLPAPRGTPALTTTAPLPRSTDW